MGVTLSVSRKKVVAKKRLRTTMSSGFLAKIDLRPLRATLDTRMLVVWPLKLRELWRRIQCVERRTSGAALAAGRISAISPLATSTVGKARVPVKPAEQEQTLFGDL